MQATLKLTIGPNASVTGANSTPSAITDVFHIALTPAGASMYDVRNGSRPCISAYGVQFRNQTKIPGSYMPLPRARVDRCGRIARQKRRLSAR